MIFLGQLDKAMLEFELVLKSQVRCLHTGCSQFPGEDEITNEG